MNRIFEHADVAAHAGVHARPPPIGEWSGLPAP
jgi:hypothetical protein